jgi:flagellar hook protein FlgE
MPVFSIPLSGLTASSTALSTIANNLANLNTVGYKDARVLFRDLFYQTLGSTGAGDPIQQGAGAAVSALSSNFNPGNIDPSGVPTDVAITGDGFFVTRGNGFTSYTRAGNFSVDDSDFLVTAEGQQVLGYPVTATGVVDTGQGLTPLTMGKGSISPPNATSMVQIQTNLDASIAANGTPYSTPVTIYDSLGGSHVLKLTFTKTATNTWDYTISMPASELNPAGTPPAPQSGILKTGTLTFNGDGTLNTPAADVTGIAITGLADGANDMSFDWRLYNGSGLLSQVASPSSTSSTQQDGTGSGSLTKFDIGSDGMIMGTFSNGKTAVIGQLALATFANVQGLERAGGNSFTSTLASGQAVIGVPGTGGRGKLSGGALELSNVDISKEFASLIIAQRAFQANARVVTTFDQITQETINLKQ